MADTDTKGRGRDKMVCMYFGRGNGKAGVSA